MSDALRDRIASDVRAVADEPRIRQRLAEIGIAAGAGTPAEFVVAIDEQRARSPRSRRRSARGLPSRSHNAADGDDDAERGHHHRRRRCCASRPAAGSRRRSMPPPSSASPTCSRTGRGGATRSQPPPARMPGALPTARTLASLGIFAEEPDGRFRHPLADCLRTTAPGSLRAFAVMLGEPAHGGPECRRAQRADRRASLRSRVRRAALPVFRRASRGRPPVQRGHDQPRRPGERRDRRDYDFSPFRTVVDVGAGEAACSPPSCARARRRAASCSTCRTSSPPRARSSAPRRPRAAIFAKATSSRRCRPAATSIF